MVSSIAVDPYGQLLHQTPVAFTTCISRPPLDLPTATANLYSGHIYQPHTSNAYSPRLGSQLRLQSCSHYYQRHYTTATQTSSLMMPTSTVTPATAKCLCKSWLSASLEQERSPCALHSRY